MAFIHSSVKCDIESRISDKSLNFVESYNIIWQKTYFNIFGTNYIINSLKTKHANMTYYILTTILWLFCLFCVAAYQIRKVWAGTAP